VRPTAGRPTQLLQDGAQGDFNEAVCAITLEQTNAAIASHAAKISVELIAKEVAAKKLMAAE
jgi:hypothetical protein